MRSTMIAGYEVCWSEQGVWVNSPKGHNVARMSKFAREVHLDECNTCASCKLGRLGEGDWKQFCADVLQFYNVQLRPGMKPKFFQSVNLERKV